MLTRLEELMAREDIRQLMARYNTAGDTGRKDAFASVFTENAQLMAPGLNLQGRDAIVAGLFPAAGSAPSVQPTFKVYRHHLTTSLVEFISELSARGRTYFLVITDIGLDHCGVYSDEFRREGDAWKLAKRQVRVDFVAPESLQFPGLHLP